jgi:hypothetical protein
MEALSSRDARRVIAAMDLLAEKGRARLIPGLILYHESPEVLLRALGLITDRDRADWPPLAERLLSNPAEGVRIEALRALARINHHVAIVRALEDDSPAVRAHAAFWASRDGERNPLETGRIRELLELTGVDGAKVRAALLDAVRDAPEPRFADLVIAILEGVPARTQDAGELDLALHAAETMTRIQDARFIPLLIRELGRRDGRAVVRDALVHQGEPALDALVSALRDPDTEPRVRIHLPAAISRFASQRAADVLAAHLADEGSGAVRYKSLRGLGHVVAKGNVKVNEAAMEAEARRNLVEHLRLLSISLRIPRRADSAAGELLHGLLDDKMRQSLDRAFMLLQIVHPTEDIKGAYQALRSDDKRLRAQAMEFLDTLTLGGDRASPVHRQLREALRVVADDLAAADRVARVTHLIPAAPADEAAALAELAEGDDAALAELAAHHARTLGLPKREARRSRVPPSRRSVEVLDGSG